MKSSPIEIKDVVSGILSSLSSGRATQAGALGVAWKRAAGEDGAKHTKPVDIKEGVLVIHVDSSSWLHRLTMDKIRILAEIKSELGEDLVRDIKLRIGEI